MENLAFRQKTLFLSKIPNILKTWHYENRLESRYQDDNKVRRSFLFLPDTWTVTNGQKVELKSFKIFQSEIEHSFIPRKRSERTIVSYKFKRHKKNS